MINCDSTSSDSQLNKYPNLNINNNDLEDMMQNTGMTENDIIFMKNELDAMSKIISDNVDNSIEVNWKDEFKKDTFDVDGLKSKLNDKIDSIREVIPEIQPHFDKIINSISAEQRLKLVKFLNEKERQSFERREQRMEKRKKHHKLKMYKFMESLNLTDEQKTEVEKLLDNFDNETKKHHGEDMKNFRDAMLNAFAEGKITEDFLKDVWNIQSTKAKNHFGKMLDFTNYLHKILTKEQRSSFADKFRQDRPPKAPGFFEFFLNAGGGKCDKRGKDINDDNYKNRKKWHDDKNK